MCPFSSVGVQLNIVATHKHVLEIEQYIRFIKKRFRAAHNLTPFKKVPIIMIIEGVIVRIF